VTTTGVINSLHLYQYRKIWSFVDYKMSERCFNLFCIYFYFLPWQETSITHKQMFWVTWSTHDWGHEFIANDSQLVFFHHASNIDVVTLSSNTSLNWYSPLWVGSHIKASWCCWRGYHWFEIHSTEHKVVSFQASEHNTKDLILHKWSEPSECSQVKGFKKA